MRIVHSERTAIGRQKKEIASSKKGKKAVSSSPVLAGAVLLKAESVGERDLYAVCDVDQMDFLLQDPERAILGDTEEEVEAQVLAKHPCVRTDATYVIPVANVKHHYKKHLTPEKRAEYEKESWAHREALSSGYDWKARAVTKGWVVVDKPYVADPKDINHLKVASIEVGALLIDQVNFENLFDRLQAAYYGDVVPGIAAANAEGFSAVPREFYNQSYVQVNYNPNLTRQKEYRQKQREISHRFSKEFPETITYSAYAILNPNHWPSGHIGAGHLRGKAMSESSGWGNRKRYSYAEREVRAVFKLGKRMNPKNPHWYRDVNSYDAVHNTLEAVCEAAFQMIHSVEKRIRKIKAELLAEIRQEYREHQERCRLYIEHTAEFQALIRLEGEGGVVVEDFPSTKEGYYYAHDRGFRVWGAHTVVVWSWPSHLEDYYKTISDPDHTLPVRYTHTEEEHVKREFLSRWERMPASAEEWFCRWLRREGKVAEVELPKPPVMPKPPKKIKRKKVKRGRRRKRQRLHGIGADFVRHVTRQARKAG